MERVADISRFFTQALDIGCGRGHFAKAVSEDLIGTLYQCDSSSQVLVRERVYGREFKVEKRRRELLVRIEGKPHHSPPPSLPK